MPTVTGLAPSDAEVRGALIHELGGIPVPGEVGVPEPAQGEVELELVAASINPIDLAVASGVFWAGHPPLPYVPGVEAVGRVVGRVGPLVYASGGGLGIGRNGTLAHGFTAPEAGLITLDDGDDPAVAVALGTAGLAGWLPLSWRTAVGPDDCVLVLGATGAAGRIAVQAARLLGAGRVVAAGRRESHLAAVVDVADAVVRLGTERTAADLAAACPDGVDVIYDPLWGEPLEQALAVTRPGCRVVHVGAAAGATATLPSALVRGRQLTILGYSNLAVPRDVLVSGYRTLLAHARAGRLAVSIETLPLDDVATAWQGLSDGAGKFVLVP